MQNQEIYESAIRFLAESTLPSENLDYKDRAPYLISAFCTEMSELDARIQRASGGTSTPVSVVNLPLDSSFPLSFRLAPAAALYVAAMLILDSDEERSDKLYAQYLEAISRISDALPATSEQTETPDASEPSVSHPIVDKYF